MGEQLVTAGFTAFFGVIVFVIGQFFQKFLLEPIQNQRKIIGEIAFNLVYLGNISSSSALEEKCIQTSDQLRLLGSRLRATTFEIPKYGLFSRLGLVPKKDNVIVASANLVGWSNSVFNGDHKIHREKIREALNLPH